MAVGLARSIHGISAAWLGGWGRGRLSERPASPSSPPPVAPSPPARSSRERGRGWPPGAARGDATKAAAMAATRPAAGAWRSGAGAPLVTRGVAESGGEGGGAGGVDRISSGCTRCWRPSAMDHGGVFTKTCAVNNTTWKFSEKPYCTQSAIDIPFAVQSMCTGSWSWHRRRSAPSSWARQPPLAATQPRCRHPVATTLAQGPPRSTYPTVLPQRSFRHPLPCQPPAWCCHRFALSHLALP